MKAIVHEKYGSPATENLKTQINLIKNLGVSFFETDFPQCPLYRILTYITNRKY